MRIRAIALISLLFVFLVTERLSAQQDTTALSTDSETFFQQVSSILLNTPSKKYQEKSQVILDRFYQRWTVGRFNKTEKESIRQLIEQMRTLKMRSYPYLYDYVYALMLLSESKQTPKSIIGWHRYAELILVEKKQKDFTDFMKFTRDLLENDRIHFQRSVSWFQRQARYRFMLDTNFLVKYEKLSIVCATKKDSSTILDTKGIYKYDHKLFTGKGGTVKWNRFGEEMEDKIYVKMQDYTISVESSSYSVDSAILYYDRFFKNPILGQFSEKIKSSTPNAKSSYPRFVSYLDDFVLEDVYPNLTFSGGFELNGLRLFGRSGVYNEAMITLERDEHLFGKIKSDLFLLGEDKVESNKSEVVFYIENDSLYHPGLRMRYRVAENKLEMFMDDERGSMVPFFDSYHNLDIYAPALFWSLDSINMDFKSLRGVRNTSEAIFVSGNYFSANDFYQIQGIDELNPMYVIQNYLKSYNEREIQLNALSAFMKKSPEQVSAMLINLANKGFLVYNARTGRAIIKDRFFDFLAAKTGRRDYDIIRLKSTVRTGPNATLNLQSLGLDVFGVPEVMLSDSQEIYIYPYDESISFRKNRDFTFNGKINMGLFDFYSRENTFIYDSFLINMNYIDTLAFSVLSTDSLERIDSVVKVRNIITELNGKINIDMPNNKSGLQRFDEFPVFQSKESSYVYFNHPDIQDSTLIPESFYYKIEPFEMDSVLTFSTQGMSFKGTLSSAGIFPPIDESLVILADYSLGFVHETPDKGYPIYGGIGTYTDTINLGNIGFWGSGKLDYLSSRSYSDNFIFYPDSLVTYEGHNFKVLESPDVYDFPYAYGDTVNIKWLVDTNLMLVDIARDSFNIYKDASLKGRLTLNPDEMGGNGSFYFEQSEISSRDFDFRYSELTADSADFYLRKDIDTLVFQSNGYFARIDFEQQKGWFDHLYANTFVEFPYNKYTSNLDKVEWEMAEDKILLKSDLGNNYQALDTLSDLKLIDYNLYGPEFISIEENPDSIIRFYAGQASYNLNNFTIDVDSVKLIKIGDAAIFPNNGYVKIMRDGGIYTLSNATIIADTVNKYHRIYDADVNIVSRHWYYANGYIDYVDRNGAAQSIYLYRIKMSPRGITVGYNEMEPTEIFFLSPEYFFTGQVNLRADVEFLNFFGGYRINEDCVGQEDKWVSFVQYIDPHNIYFDLDANSVDMSQQPTLFGLALSKENYEFYPLVLQSKESSNDEVLISATGKINYNNETLSYHVGHELPEGKTFGETNTVSLNTERCVLEGNGRFDFGLNLNMFNTTAAGEFRHLIIPDSTYLKTALMFDFFIDEQLMNMMIDSLRIVNSYKNLSGEGSLPLLFTQLMGEEGSQRMIVEWSLYGQAKRMPDELRSVFMFSDVNFEWDKKSRSWVSNGPIGIAQIAGIPVNKYVQGYIQIEKSRTSDGISWYLQLNQEQWYFFSYKNGILQVMSSDNSFNDYVSTLKDDKRILNANSDVDYYEFVISTRRKVIDFLREMEAVEKRLR